MTTSLAIAAAFVATRMTGNLSRSLPLAPTVATDFANSSMTKLDAVAPPNLPLKDYSGDAINYFFSVRTPAALLAGSSLAAIFSLKALTTNDSLSAENRLTRSLLLLYHFLGLLSFCMSIIVIVTTTTAGNSFLLRAEEPLATSCNAFLIRECEFEFILTRFSFYTSLLSFLASVALRVIFEFDLLRKDRKRSCSIVVFSMGSLFLHLLAFINDRLFLHSNLFAMGVTLLKMTVRNTLQRRSICQLLSLACGLMSVVVTASLFLNPSVREVTAEKKNIA